MVYVKYLNGGNPDHTGLIPLMLDLNDDRPAAEQFDAKYSHGGGWSPGLSSKWKMDKETAAISYPDDPVLKPKAIMTLRDEKIYVYDYAWVCIVQPDNTFSISRMD